MVPGGVITVSGRKAPEFTSVPGSRNDLMMVKAPVGAIAGPTLVGAAVWGEVPVRSTVIVVARDDDARAHASAARAARARSRGAPRRRTRRRGSAPIARRMRSLGAVHQLRHRRPDRRRRRSARRAPRPARPPCGRCRSWRRSRPAARGARACCAKIRSSAAWLGRPAVHDADGRDAHAFLEDLGGVAGEAARAHAAHVAPVRAHHREDEELARPRRADRSWPRR